MKKPLVIFLLLLMTGAGVRIMALQQLHWFMGDSLHVDEITYTEGDSPPFERPPGTYLAASVFQNTGALRLLFSLFSLLPSLFFYIFRRKSVAGSLTAGLLAVEPTLAFSGLQILPAAPAAALVSLALCLKERSLLSGWFLGCAALFRGELLLFVPLALLLLRPAGKRFSAVGGFAAAILPVMLLNFTSGGPFSIAENGPVNLWLGTSWERIATPPGMEFEELMGKGDYTGSAFREIVSSPVDWIAMGALKTGAFVSVPGPGRNLETGYLMKGTVLWYLLPVTFLALAAGLSGIRRNSAGIIVITGLVAAFVFFPSVRYRAVFVPALFLSGLNPRRIPAVITGLVIGAFSFGIGYPGRVREGLTQVQHAQNLLQSSRFHQALACLERAEERGYRGADLHTMKGACIASSGGDFQDALHEFSRALEMAPESPSAWKNIAALLWNYGYTEDARYAAEKAVSLNPLLRDELAPLLARDPGF